MWSTLTKCYLCCYFNTLVGSATIKVISLNDSWAAHCVLIKGAIIKIITALNAEPLVGWFNDLDIVIVSITLVISRISVATVTPT